MGAYPSWCALPSASENSKEMIFSLREWLAIEISLLSDMESWQTESSGGSRQGRRTGYSSETLKTKLS
jgi:hypothetical protein